jgi:hypothetical protein
MSRLTSRPRCAARPTLPGLATSSSSGTTRSGANIPAAVSESARRAAASTRAAREQARDEGEPQAAAASWRRRYVKRHAGPEGAARRLFRLLDGWQSPEISSCILYRTELRGSPKLRAFLAAVSD